MSKEKDAYGRIAKRYDQIFESLNAGLYGVAMKIHPPTADMIVLDVGCGTGTQLARYKEAGCQIYGIDMSRAMLEVARTKLGEDADLRYGDASNMPYEDNMFDLVLSTLVIHEMSPDLRSGVLKEIRRVLKDDGRLLVIDFHPGKLKLPGGLLNKIIIVISEIAAGRETLQELSPVYVQWRASYSSSQKPLHDRSRKDRKRREHGCIRPPLGLGKTQDASAERITSGEKGLPCAG